MGPLRVKAQVGDASRIPELSCLPPWHVISMEQRLALLRCRPGCCVGNEAAGFRAGCEKCLLLKLLFLAALELARGVRTRAGFRIRRSWVRLSLVQRMNTQAFSVSRALRCRNYTCSKELYVCARPGKAIKRIAADLSERIRACDKCSSRALV